MWKDYLLLKEKYKETKMKKKKALYVGWRESEPNDTNEEENERTKISKW